MWPFYAICIILHIYCSLCRCSNTLSCITGETIPAQACTAGAEYHKLLVVSDYYLHRICDKKVGKKTKQDGDAHPHPLFTWLSAFGEVVGGGSAVETAL